ncbi:type 1 glutamine amidotransferase [Flavobacterium sp. PL11]|jgi:type 1 glutamine amidotransferase|uniref:ThuA domain-containing protein n=1 Tax=Flavobacterium sp. PL11 TaxID=3071717 RepID=UPI002E050CA8|nr:type 1 glutamine amidotransferase [Flavobacterium sp. PL11]
MKIKVILLAVIFSTSVVWANPLTKKRVLVYTKNGKGFVHTNIAASVTAFIKIGQLNNLIVDVSNDPSVMNNKNLSKYSCLIFSNTNNEIFDNEQQRQDFATYIRNGGAFVGIHIASGSERNWPWFHEMIGGLFIRHPAYQLFDIKVIDKKHPATTMLPAVWKKEDECYFMTELNPISQVLLAADLRTVIDSEKSIYPGRTFGDYFPLAWCHEFEGARVFYTALGHDEKDYSEPLFVQHLTGGLLWALGKN